MAASALHRKRARQQVDIASYDHTHLPWAFSYDERRSSPLFSGVCRTWLPASCQSCNMLTGLLLRQLHRLEAEAQLSLGISAEDADMDMHRSLVTVFNSRLDM